jgi:ATP-binding cassette subfamily B protein
MRSKNYKKIFVKQHSEFTCGLACLSMIIKYYGGEVRQEDLRYISGTTIQGTTLLGLYQAAQKVNLIAEGFEADIDNLKIIQSPIILHVIKNDINEHYIVCFGFERGKFIIGDPELGIINMSEKEIELIWKRKVLLTIKPSESFKKNKHEKINKYIWLKNILKADVSILSSIFALGVIISLLGLTTAIFSQKLIDDLLPSKDYTKLIIGIIMFFVLLIFNDGLNYLRNIFIVRQIKDFNNRVIGDFFSKILYLPKSFFDSIKTGEIVARMNDSRRIQQTITFIISETLVDFLVLLFSIICLFFYSLEMASIASICIPMFIILVLLYNKRIIENQEKVMRSYAATEALFMDSIQGINDIKIMNKQNFFKDSINVLYGVFQNNTFKLGILGAQYGFVSHIISTITMVFIVIIGVVWVLNGQLKLGELMAIITISSMIITSTANLSVVNIRFHEASVAFTRLYEFLKVEPEFKNENKSSNILNNPEDVFSLIIKKISYRFIGCKKLFTDISLEVNKGELIILCGAVGSGKSTLMQILQKHYQPESGEILINGNSFDNYSTLEWRCKIGVLNQYSKIFNGTVGENICLDNFDKEKDAVIQFCIDYRFDSFIDKLPQGLYTLLGEDGVNISGGQQQLILIMRALYRKPSLLLLDEPTSSMDDETEQFVINTLELIKPNLAIIIVTHKAQFVNFSDRVYFLDNGSIKEIL